jgi:hypothetical protein
MLVKTLDIGDILQAITTIVVSIIITVVFAKRQTKQNRTNDLMINWVTEIIQLTEVFDDVDSGVKLSSVVSTLTKIKGKLGTLKEAASNTTGYDLTDCVEQRIGELSTIRHLLTDTPVQMQMADVSRIASVEDGILRLGESRYADLDNVLCRFRSELFKLQIAINNQG